MYSLQENPDAVIVDYRMPAEMISAIERLNIKTIKTIRHPYLYDAIKGHPDILACPLQGLTVVEPLFFEEKYQELKDYLIQKGKTILGKKYPDTIAYNFCTIGNSIIGNLEYMDEKILERVDELSLRRIHIAQGYAKCNMAVLDENTVISSDPSIYEALSKTKDIKVIKISGADVMLEPFEYGFLGGATALLSKKRMAFMGDLYYYINGKEIENILHNKNIEIINLAATKLYDCGSLIPLYKV